MGLAVYGQDIIGNDIRLESNLRLSQCLWIVEWSEDVGILVMMEAKPASTETWLWWESPRTWRPWMMN